MRLFNVRWVEWTGSASRRYPPPEIYACCSVGCVVDSKAVATGGGLTPSQTAVLNRLWKDGASSTSALATAEQVRPQSMATIVTALDQHGLIARAPDPNDGRRQVISLTAAGRRRAESDRQAREEWLARAMQERYSERERRVINDALSLLSA